MRTRRLWGSLLESCLLLCYYDCSIVSTEILLLGRFDPLLLAHPQDEACQESRAEEPHGVMYAELNARALSEGPSNQMKQPLETCVYSTLKT